MVRKGGIKLFSNKYQYITITRAFFKNSKILLLNKAISTMDNITKKLIRKSLKSQGKD